MVNDLNPSAGHLYESSSSKMSIDEAHEDLNEFNLTRKTVTDLLMYRRSLKDMDGNDPEKIKEIKSKALEAINHLFDEMLITKKGE